MRHLPSLDKLSRAHAAVIRETLENPAFSFHVKQRWLQQVIEKAVREGRDADDYRAVLREFTVPEEHRGDLAETLADPAIKFGRKIQWLHSIIDHAREEGRQDDEERHRITFREFLQKEMKDDETAEWPNLAWYVHRVRKRCATWTPEERRREYAKGLRTLRALTPARRYGPVILYPVLVILAEVLDRPRAAARLARRSEAAHQTLRQMIEARKR